MYIPKDPVMLLSFTNMKLRDQYSSLDKLCDDLKLNKEELLALYKKSGLPLKRFFNTSGLKYRELNLKDKLPTMSEDEQLTLLASDGMLVKRPIIETDDRVLVGFKANEYDSLK